VNDHPRSRDDLGDILTRILPKHFVCRECGPFVTVDEDGLDHYGHETVLRDTKRYVNRVRRLNRNGHTNELSFCSHKVQYPPQLVQ
jgi:hypothetical protein